MKHGPEWRLAATGGPGFGDSPDPTPMETDEERWHDELFEHWVDEEDWEWPEDPDVVLAWNVGRTRRVLVRIAAWGVIAAATFSLAEMAAIVPKAGSEVVFWMTMGRLGDTCPSADAVRENARAESRGEP